MVFIIIYKLKYGNNNQIIYNIQLINYQKALLTTFDTSFFTTKKNL